MEEENMNTKYPKIVLVNDQKCRELRERFYNLFTRDSNFHDRYLFTISRDKDLINSYLYDCEQVHLMKLEAKGII